MRDEGEEERYIPPGLERPEDEPETPVIPEGTRLPGGIRAELKGIPADLAEIVAAHLWMAGELIDDDPELAFRHAEAARRRAARLPITREASAETAYAAEKYDEALTQYRALRRMTGSDDYLPVIADCLRALGKYREALDVIAEGKKANLDSAMGVELLIVQAGIRVDMGQSDEAKRLLRQEIDHPTMRHPRVAQARLLYAYSDLLEQSGDVKTAHKGFQMAAQLDTDRTTSALERLDELDGVTFDIDEAEFAPEIDEEAIFDGEYEDDALPDDDEEWDDPDDDIDHEDEEDSDEKDPSDSDEDDEEKDSSDADEAPDAGE